MLYSPIYNQIGIQNSNRAPDRRPPPTKLPHARNTRITRIEPLQNISNVLMHAMYNEIAEGKMGIIPHRMEGCKSCHENIDVISAPFVSGDLYYPPG
jgi:hypothetical protein